VIDICLRDFLRHPKTAHPICANIAAQRLILPANP
jgi:hypothetical protein